MNTDDGYSYYHVTDYYDNSSIVRYKTVDRGLVEDAKLWLTPIILDENFVWPETKTAQTFKKCLEKYRKLILFV